MPTEEEVRAAIETAANLWRTNTLAFCYRFEPEVIHPKFGAMRFDPYVYQKDLWDCLDVGGWPLMLKARQVGISAGVMLQKLQRCMSRPNNSVLIVADIDDSAQERIRDLLYFYETCKGPFPDDWPTLVTENRHELAWSNGSRAKALAARKQPGRGYGVSDLVLDEFAFWPWQKEMWAAISPTISLGGSIAIISTPNGEGDLFHKRWMSAKGGDTAWTPFRLPWQVCPAYDEEWAAEKRKEYTTAVWKQEYCCDFTSAGGTVIQPQYIDAAIGGEASGPVEGHSYQIGVDVSGEGQDLTVAAVLDVTESPWQVVQVSVWEVLPAQALQREMENLGTQYGCAPYIDATGLGWAVAGNMNTPCVGVVFTAGNAEPSYNEELMRWTCPRNKLIANFVKTFEDGLCKVPAEFESLIDACRGLRWSKKESNLPDYSDALMLALFAAGPAAPDWWIG